MPLQTQDGKLRLGGEVTLDIQNVLSKCPNPNAILEHLQDFSEEITDAHGQYTIEADRATEESRKTIEEAARKLGLLKPIPAEPIPKEKKKRDLNVKKKKEEQIKSKPTFIKPETQEIKTQSLEQSMSQPSKKIIEETKNTMSDLETETSFEQELDEFEQKLEQPEPSIKDKVMEALSKIKDAPSPALIAKWKREFGEDGVHVTVFSEREIYIYKHLTRAQWTKVQEMISKMQTTKANVSEDDLKEKVVRHCMLWPTLDINWTYNSRAGVLDAIYQGVMINSYFLSPQQVAALSTEL